MRPIELRPFTQNGEQLEPIPIEGFGIPEEGDESPGGTNQEIVEQVSALYETVLTHLRDRHAAPQRGHTWLKIVLGEAILTADEQAGDVVMIEVLVRPFVEGEDDESFDTDEN